MSDKDLPEVNQPEEGMASDSGAEPSAGHEETVQPDEPHENDAGETDKADGGSAEESIEALKAALQQKENEVNELMDRLQRLAAEYDNYRKRTNREKERLYNDSVCDVVSRFLPVVDNLERAVSAAATGEAKTLLEGINMICRQMTDILDKMGIKPIEAVGKTFDPELHHAVMHVEDENYGSGEIIEEFQKGYIYKDQTVIRHSMVKVAN